MSLGEKFVAELLVDPFGQNKERLSLGDLFTREIGRATLLDIPHDARRLLQFAYQNQSVFDCFQDLPQLEANAIDLFIDNMLRIPPYSYSKFSPQNEREEIEQLWYQGTSYKVCSKILSAFNPQPRDVVYDLGSGFGRFVLFGAVNKSEATFKGIEINHDAKRQAEAASRWLELPNVQFIGQNVTNVDVSDGTMFYMYNPFSEPTRSVTLFNIREVAQRRPIKFITYSMNDQSDFKDAIPHWLQKIDEFAPFKQSSRVQIFESKSS